VGIRDKRSHVDGIKGEVKKGGEPHNAYTDCKLEGEILWRIKKGENLFPEYKKFGIPDYLRK
jgi:hypothetical protein